MRFPILILLVAVYTPLLHRLTALSVPNAFSYLGKSYILAHPTLSQVLQLLSRYEVDTHMEVVLIGESFSASTAREINNKLESLSKVAAFASPLSFVHEKIIYHTTSGRILLDSVREIIENKGDDSLDPSLIDKVFAEYHLSATTTTTLFVLNSSTHSSSFKRSYSYSSFLPHCSQRAFISDDSSFAWLDISATAEDILPYTGRHTMSHSALTGTLTFNLDSLAALIHASGEALSPFPCPGFRSVDYTLASTATANEVSASSSYYRSRRDLSGTGGPSLPPPPRNVHILIMTICVDDSILVHSTGATLCSDDIKSLQVAEQIARTYKSSWMHISTSTIVIRASQEAQIAHAIHASISHSQTGIQHEILSADEFLYWLGLSAAIRDAMTSAVSTGSLDTVVVPVFVLRMLTAREVFFDQDLQQTLALPFQTPPGLDSSHRWPHTAVLAIRYASERVTPSLRNDMLESQNLQCAGISLPAGEGYPEDQMRHAMREAIWNLPPPRYHYSAASRSMVQNFLWWSPPALTGGKTNSLGNFREKRAVARQTFIHLADNVLRRFAEAIGNAASIIPAVNITALLDLTEPPSETPSKPRNAKAMMAKQPTSTRKTKAASSAAKIRSNPTGLLYDFLFEMNDAAVQFSILDYHEAIFALRSAEKKTLILESRIADIISARTGDLICAQNDVDASATQNKDESSAEMIKEPSAWSRYYRWFLALIGLIVGIIANVMASEAKSGARITRRP